MLAVELRGSGGEDLNLANNTTAEIKLPLDANLVSSAPTTIPLWYFDEVNGYWIEDGEASLVDDTYVGTVSHFSFWNADTPFESVNLCVTVVNEMNDPIPNLRLFLSSDYVSGQGFTYTDNLGQACGSFPINSNGQIKISTPFNTTCLTSILQISDIGPFTSDSAIEFVLADYVFEDENIIGSYNDCNGDLVNNGYVVLRYENWNFYDLVTDGNFEIDFIRCSDQLNFSVEAIDYDNLQSSGVINYSLDTPITNIGFLQSCNNINEQIIYEIDGNQELILPPFDVRFMDNNPEVNNNATIEIQDNLSSFQNCFWLRGIIQNNPIVGEHVSSDSYNTEGFYFVEGCPAAISNPQNSEMTFNITQFGPAGDFLDMDISGDYVDFNGASHTFSATIHVLRDE